MLKRQKKIFVLKGKSAYNVLRLAADEVCEGFRACNYEVEMVDALEPEALQKFLDFLEHRDAYSFYFSFQALLWEAEAGKLPWLQEVKKVGWIVDDPVYHSGRLIGNTGKNAEILIVRDSHAEQIKREYPKFVHVKTLYHGGFVSDSRIEYSDKDIDVFFSGGYTPLWKTEQELRKIEGVFGTLAWQAKDTMVGDNLASFWDVELRKYMQKIDFSVTEEEFQMLRTVLQPLDAYQRNWMREKLIEHLLKSGIKVTVVGPGWSSYAGEEKENLEILSDQGVDIEDVIKLMQRSKIVLNNTNIIDGMHERIFTAMLANAVCVTNEYAMLRHFFEDGKEIVTYPLNCLEKLPGIVKDLLEHPKKAEEIARAGYEAALEKHTWQQRGKQIVKYMEDGQDFVY